MKIPDNDLIDIKRAAAKIGPPMLQRLLAERDELLAIAEAAMRHSHDPRLSWKQTGQLLDAYFGKEQADGTADKR